MFLTPNILIFFLNLNSNLLDLRNLKEQVKKAFRYQKLFWPFRTFTVRTNCCSDLKMFTNFQPSASIFKIFSQSLEQFLVTIYHNNFGNKIAFLTHSYLVDMHFISFFILGSNENLFLRFTDIYIKYQTTRTIIYLSFYQLSYSLFAIAINRAIHGNGK